MAKFCEECGSPLNPGEKFCPSCGTKVPLPEKPAIPKQPPEAPEAPAQPSRPVSEPVRPSYSVPSSGVFIPEEFARRNEERKQNGGKSVGKTPTAAKGGAVPAASASGGGASASGNTAPAAGKTKKSRKGGLIFVAVLLIAAFLFTGFIAPGFLRKKGGGNGDAGGKPSNTSPKVVKTEESKVSAENPAATLCGVTVDVIPESLGGESKNLKVCKLEDTTEDGVKCENYELELGSHERFAVPVEVTFPCSVTSGYDPTVEHYNPETQEWEPLLSFVDEAKGTVTAYFGSFSPARVSYLPAGADPHIYRVVTDKNNEFAPKIGISSNYWRILQRINPSVYGNEVTKFIDNPENYAVNFPELDPNMDAKAAYEAFTKSSQMWTFIDPLINLGINELPSQGQNAVVKFIADNAESLGNAMNVIPFIIMGAQVAFDLNSGDPDAMNTAAVNLYKNLITSSGTIYSLTTGYSHIGFTLAFFGVALFGMELDYLVDAAKAEQKANVKSVFESYYTNTAPFDAYHWYEVFEKAYWDNEGNADAAMKAVKEAVDSYCNQFWTQIYNDEGSDAFWETLSDSEYRKIFTNATEEDKALLTEQQKVRVWELIEKHSMKIIRRFLLERMQEDTRKELYAVVEMYNMERTIGIRETVNRGAEAELTGYTVCFGYDTVPFPGWHVNIPEDYVDGWSINFDYTVYGYMQMGMPIQVLFYLDEDDFNEAVRTQGKGERPSYIYPFSVDVKSKDPGTLIDINFGDPYQAKSDEFSGYEWNSLSYGGEISSDIVNGAIVDAVRNTKIKLDKDGNFNVSSSGGKSDSGSGSPGPNDSYSYGANATLTMSGHIDKGTGDGTFNISITVTYHHRRGSPYSGYDSVNATVTIKGGGDISGEIQGDDTFDPAFGGDVTVHRQGTWSHEKGSAAYDHDGSETMNASEEYYCKLLFIANN